MSIVRIGNVGDQAREYGESSRLWVLHRAFETLGGRGEPKGCLWGMSGQTAGEPLTAYIWNGEWVADCDCVSRAEREADPYLEAYRMAPVDPGDPVFYCPYCDNKKAGGEFRPVVFPENRQPIEAEVIEKAIRDSCCDDPTGKYAVERWLNWTPEDGYLGFPDFRQQEEELSRVTEGEW